MLKSLDRKEGTSWRFWARLVLGILPTMSRMAKFATQSPEGMYAKVYMPDIGVTGRCTQPGCTAQKESTYHAIIMRMQLR